MITLILSDEDAEQYRIFRNVHCFALLPGLTPKILLQA